MTLPILLFVLRLAGAVVLLLFLGVIIWLIYRDLQAVESSFATKNQPQGAIHVIANESATPAVGVIFPLLPVTSIGRAPSNNIVLPDGYASGDHALITLRNGQWWLQDQDSRNGTFLNEVRIHEVVVLSSGDIVSIGGTQLKIEV